jgi:RNA polymerase sigma-70 factor (ECF subfamily)
LDEKEAVELLKQGKLEGLEVLVHTYQLQALRAAGLILGDRGLAEEIVQNAFIRAAGRIAQFDSGRSFGPWFLRSVVNDAFKAARRQSRFIALDAVEEGGAIDLTDPTPLPEEMVEREETIRAVGLALSRLSPLQRAAIVLRYSLGMSEAEISRELHSPVGSIKWRLHAARQRLAGLLRPGLQAAEDEERRDG